MAAIRVSVNGRDHEVSEDLSLVELLESLGIDPRRVAVERNREVVPRALHPQVRVADGDAFEVVQFVGGG